MRIHRDSCAVTERLVYGKVTAQRRILREYGDVFADFFAAVIDTADMHFALFALAVDSFEKFQEAGFSLPGAPDDGEDFACGQVEVDARKELLFPGEYVQVAHVDVEAYGRLAEQQRSVLRGDFRLVVTGGFVFAEDYLLVALAFLVGYGMAELDFGSVFVRPELDFVFRSLVVNLARCGRVFEFDSFHFVVCIEQQQR